MTFNATHQPNALTYNGLITQVCLLAPYQYGLVSGVVTPSNQPEFTALIPQMLNYAEQRIMRDLNLNALHTGAPNVYTLAPPGGTLQIPAGDFVTIEAIIAYYGQGYQPVLPVSRDYFNSVFLPAAPPGPPRAFAMIGGDFQTAGLTSLVLAFGPAPDQPYPIYVYGTIRAPSLAIYATNATNASTQTTWISTWLPDLLVMACMIFVSAYQRDFGRQSDDPQLAQSYENQYQLLLKSVNAEEYRKRFEADAWTAEPRSPVATPTR